MTKQTTIVVIGSLRVKPKYWDTLFLTTFVPNPLMLSGHFYLNDLESSIFNRRGVGYFLIIPCFIEIPVLNAKHTDPDQSQRLRCLIWVYTLTMSLLWDARRANQTSCLRCLIWVYPLTKSLLWDARRKWVKFEHQSIN